MRPILFYTVGLPGAGKTTLARGLSFLLEAEHLRGDKIGLEIFRFPTFSAEERRIVYSEMARRAGEHLSQGRHVMYDAATNTAAQREQIVQLAKQHGAQPIGLWVQTAIPTAKKRAARARDSGIAGAVVRVVPPHIFDQYAAAFETPESHEPVVILSGEAPLYLQYRRLMRQLRPAGMRLPRLIQ
jgi:predicted kinase